MTDAIAKIKNRFWVRLFLKVGIIFLAFVLLLTLCNTAFLKPYYEYVNKEELKEVSGRLRKIDLDLKADVVDIISYIEEEYGFETEIYSANGRTLYSSSGGQLMDYFLHGNDKLFMNHRPLKAIETRSFPDGSVMERAVDIISENEY